MSAGSGIVHAERNDAFRLDPAAPAEPVHFVQMWVRPDEPGGRPSYQQRRARRRRSRAALAAGGLGPRPGRGDQPGQQGFDPVGHHASARASPAGCRRPRGCTSIWPAARSRSNRSGVLEAGDALRLVGEAQLSITGIADAELLAWELAA